MQFKFTVQEVPMDMADRPNLEQMHEWLHDAAIAVSAGAGAGTCYDEDGRAVGHWHFAN